MVYLARPRLNRRTFLRGSGVALGMPLLEAMASGSPRRPPAKPPTRAAFLFFPNGVWEPSWIPKEAGANYALPFSLEPLLPVKKDVLVLTGLDKAHSRQGDGHYAKTANFLTGLPVRKTTGKEIDVGGPSVDQIFAQAQGQLTPLPSLELAVDPVISGIDSNVGFTRLYGSYISWKSATMPMAREIHPRATWDRLFALQTAARQRRDNQDKPNQKSDDDRLLLDLVAQDARDLRGKLGRDDQVKLDEYLDAVRAVEKQIEFFSRPDPRSFHPDARAVASATKAVAAPANAPGDHLVHVRLMLDLMVLAFQTDATRVATFMFSNDVSGRDFSGLIPGTRGGHHELSHHGKKATSYEPYAKIVRWHVEQFAYMLNRMAKIREGNNRLLDNSMVLFGSGMSDGNRHDPDNLPMLLGGRGGGTIKSGRHLVSTGDVPLCNLHLAILQRLGVPATTFGDATGPLPL